MLPCMESLNLSGFTYKLTGLPLTSWLNVESLWQARQSSLLGFGTGFAPAAAKLAVNPRKASVRIVLFPTHPNLRLMAFRCLSALSPCRSSGQSHSWFFGAAATMSVLTGCRDVSQKRAGRGARSRVMGSEGGRTAARSTENSILLKGVTESARPGFDVYAPGRPSAHGRRRCADPG